MNPRLASLQSYPFEKLQNLIQHITPNPARARLTLAIGEPQHAAPEFVRETLETHWRSVSSYPSTRGPRALREAIAQWLERRFALPPLDPDRHILPASGTREALFGCVQAAVGETCTTRPVVILPNPFYQIYEGATLLAGAEPYFLNTGPEQDYRMDFSTVPEAIWRRTCLVFVCTPGNPTGTVLSVPELQALLERAERYDFMLASDECYSEIYFDEQQPPPGLLQAAAMAGVTDYRRCLVFHSLSKRSSLPGLRSGFVAGDPDFLAGFHTYRTYQGSALSSLAHAISIRAWSDEQHVRENRALYRQKFDAVLNTLAPCQAVRPDAGFYLWLPTPGPDDRFAQGLYAAENVLVLPGSYLSRDAHGQNPGRGYVRIALVASPAHCLEAAERIRRYTLSEAPTGAVHGYSGCH